MTSYVAASIIHLALIMGIIKKTSKAHWDRAEAKKKATEGVGGGGVGKEGGGGKAGGGKGNSASKDMSDDSD